MCGLYLQHLTSFPSSHLGGVIPNNSLTNTHPVPIGAGCSSSAWQGKKRLGAPPPWSVYSKQGSEEKQ